MTTFFISRHRGAVDWARHKGLKIDLFVTHLDTSDVQIGDIVIGSLPVNLAAQVCARGAAYWHLNLDLPADMRGRELSADEMLHFAASIKPFEIRPASTQKISIIYDEVK